MKTYHLFFLSTFFLLGFEMNAQNEEIYAGLETSMMPNGVSLITRRALLRPDGTYVFKLGEPDWKTRIDGTYKRDGQNIILYRNNGKKRFTMKWRGKTYLVGGSGVMSKLTAVSQLPQGTYKYRRGNTYSGEGVFISKMNQSELSIDGQNKFSFDGFSGLVTAGTMGGGGTKKNSNVGTGTYTLNNGEMTLNYDGGQTTKHSVFISEGNKTTMMLFDGKIYFLQKDKETATSTPRETTTPNTTSSPSLDASQLLLAAKAKHGGAGIDNIKTVRMEGSIASYGIDVTLIVDLQKKWARYEFFQQGKLVSIEQVGSGSGWTFTNGSTKTLPSKRKQEMEQVFHSNILGLSTAALSTGSIVDVQQKAGYYFITIKYGTDTKVLTLNEEYELVAEGVSGSWGSNSTKFSNHKEIEGVTMGFTNKVKSGVTNLTINYSNIKLNPTISADRWVKP